MKNPIITHIGKEGPISLRDYIDLALYHPQWGYYRKTRNRIGLLQGTDFYTSSTFREIFGRLLVEAISEILDCPLSRWTFVELGADAAHTILEGLPHPFAKLMRLHTEEIDQVPSPSVVFSNELFDAQPFHRLKFIDGIWKETGVQINSAVDGLEECFLESVSKEIRPLVDALPADRPDNYVLDLPWPAEQLLRGIVSAPWNGLFITFDYGKFWNELISQTPAGSGRTYSRHMLGENLLENPGNQDITCHICWDRMSKLLEEADFQQITLERQETFFVKNSFAVISEIMNAESTAPLRDKQRLKELIHPAFFGAAFSVLRGIRAF